MFAPYNVIIKTEVKMLSEKKMKEAGEVIHYYPRIGVAVVELKAPLSVGDKIVVRGVTTDFAQTVESMQIEHEQIVKAEAGQSVGLKVEERVRERDTVYKVPS